MAEKKAVDKSTAKKAWSIVADPNVAAGRFATNVAASMGPDHCVLTFLAEEPLQTDGDGTTTAHMAARVYLTLPHLRKLSALLDGHVQRLDAEEKKSSAAARSTKN